MKLRRINFDHGAGCGCGDCTGGNAKSYFEGLEQKPNIEQLVPVPGPSGENSILVAGKTDPSGALNADGADEALDSAAKANLLAADFDITEKPTTQNVVDASDTNSNRVWTGLSRSLLNFLGLKVVPKLLPDFGTSGNIVKDNGTAWVSGAPDWEKYNSTTTTPYAYTSTSYGAIGSSIEFTVGTGYAYKFKNIVAIVDPSNPANYIEGIVTNYALGKVTVQIKNLSGGGNTSGWGVMLTAPEYLPYVNDPANYGKFYYNNNGIIEMRISTLSVGFVFPWHNPSNPDGFIPCDGASFAKTEYPALYEHLRPGGAVNKYAFAMDGTTPLGIGNCRTPGYNTGRIPYGVADPGDLGVNFGANEYVLVGDNLPEVPPYNMPDHTHGPKTPGVGFLEFTASGGDVISPAPGFGVFSASETGGVSGGATIPITNNTGTGGTAIDMRQSSEGCFYIIKT